jgi:uncharacterized membrane protein YedE/YeeE
MKEDFVMAIAGGALIGLAATLLLLVQGRIAGISGVLGQLIGQHTTDRNWRMTFLVGLFAGGALVVWLSPEMIVAPNHRSLSQLIAAGLLVGYGTRLGNGCTSGHGVCGLSRRSGRSLAATVTFMATGFGTATFIGWLMGAHG